MECLFRSVLIIDPRSPHHQKVRDIWIKSGKIHQISSKIQTPKNIIILESKNSIVSPGWVDIACYGGEPGFEERENLPKLANAALAGGYTRVAYMPNTNPCIHSKSEVHFIINKSKNLGLYIHPIGAVSKNNSAIEMAEILQMHEAGAVAFSDGNYGIQKSGFLRRILEYLRLLPETILIQHSFDEDLSPKSQIHESPETSTLGLRPNPSLAEYSAVQRDVSILEYTGSKMLLNKISTSKSIQIIRKNKKNNPGLFASVSVFNLAFTDKDMSDFNANLKLMPPLRSIQDQKALWKAVEDGTVDIIISDHTPINAELKDLEFQNAAFGAISLETSFALFNTYAMIDNSIEHWIQKVAVKPRNIISIPSAIISEGEVAEITWFDPNKIWKYSPEQIQSLSKNSPLINKNLKGKVLAVYNKSNLFDYSKL